MHPKTGKEALTLEVFRYGEHQVRTAGDADEVTSSYTIDALGRSRCCVALKI